jgi:hypothetical protein
MGQFSVEIPPSPGQLSAEISTHLPQLTVKTTSVADYAALVGERAA